MVGSIKHIIEAWKEAGSPKPFSDFKKQYLINHPEPELEASADEPSYNIIEPQKTITQNKREPFKHKLRTAVTLTTLRQIEDFMNYYKLPTISEAAREIIIRYFKSVA